MLAGSYDAVMLIYLDDVAVELQGQTLGELLHAASHQLSDSSRIIAEVRQDGEPLTPEALDAAQGEAPTGEIHLISTDARRLSLDVLEQVQQRLQESGEIMESAAALFQQDRATEGMEKIGAAMQVWQQVQQAVSQSATLMKVNLDALEYDGRTIDAWSTELLEKFKQLRSSIEAGDVVGLSDALAYEWPEQIEHWRGIIGRLMSRIQVE